MKAVYYSIANLLKSIELNLTKWVAVEAGSIIKCIDIVDQYFFIEEIPILYLEQKCVWIARFSTKHYILVLAFWVGGFHHNSVKTICFKGQFSLEIDNYMTKFNADHS